jgi:hypothetical protein
MLAKPIWLALSLGLLAEASAAVIYSETHNITSGSPTTSVRYHMGIDGDGPGSWGFDFTTFTVSATGLYSFRDKGWGLGSTINDTKVGFYDATFNSSNLAQGWLTGADDGNWQFGESLTISLTAGQTYTIVTGPYRDIAEFDNLGDIAWEVDGPDGATLTPVPEPTTAVLVSAAGLLGVAVWRRATGRTSRG